MKSSFETRYDAITAIPDGTAIRAWSAAGQARTTFTKVHGGPGAILVRTEKGGLVTVPREDFEKVHAIWPDYLSGVLRRPNIRTYITRFSTYVITLLRHTGM